MRILLVDDVEDSRDIIRLMLEKLGHEVLEAENGKHALRVALDQRPEFIFMDLSMPEVDGFQATGALRSISTFIDVPVVAITAAPPELAKERAMDAGCDGYLSKPVSMEDLAAVLKKYSRPA